MEALYFQTNGLIQETQQCFQQLNNVRVDSVALEAEIITKLATVNALVSTIHERMKKVQLSMHLQELRPSRCAPLQSPGGATTKRQDAR